MQAINYFQSMFSFRSCSAISFGKSANQLAHALTGEGRAFAAIAETEMLNGETALNITVNEKDENLKHNLAQIAVWHYRQAANRCRAAADAYGQAARIWRQTKRRRLLERKTRKMLELALQCEASVELLMKF